MKLCKHMEQAAQILSRKTAIITIIQSPTILSNPPPLRTFSQVFQCWTGHMHIHSYYKYVEIIEPKACPLRKTLRTRSQLQWECSLPAVTSMFVNYSVLSYSHPRHQYSSPMVVKHESSSSPWGRECYDEMLVVYKCNSVWSVLQKNMSIWLQSYDTYIPSWGLLQNKRKWICHFRLCHVCCSTSHLVQSS